MKILSLPRQRGKTTHLLRMLCENEDMVLYVIDYREKRRLEQLFQQQTHVDRKAVASRIKVFGRDTMEGLDNKEVWIDNLEMCLVNLTRHSVSGFSISEPITVEKLV